MSNSIRKRIYKRSLTPLAPVSHPESNINGPLVVSIPEKNKIVFTNPSQEFYSRRTRLIQDDQNMEPLQSYSDETAETVDTDENQEDANKYGNYSEQEPNEPTVIPIYGNNGKNVVGEEDTIDQSEYEPRYDQQKAPPKVLKKRPAHKKNMRSKCSRKKNRNIPVPNQPQLEEDDYMYSATNGYKLQTNNDYHRSANVNQKPLFSAVNSNPRLDHELPPVVDLFTPNRDDAIDNDSNHKAYPNEDSTRLASDVVNTYMQKQDEWKTELLNELRESLSDCCETCRSRTIKKLNDRLENIQDKITKELSEQYKEILNSVQAPPQRNHGKSVFKKANNEDIIQVQLDKNLGDYFKRVVFKISQKPESPSLRKHKANTETRQNPRRKYDRLYNDSQSDDNVPIEAMEQPFEPAEYTDRPPASGEYAERAQESDEYLDRRKLATEEPSSRHVSKTRNFRKRTKQPKLNYISDRES